MIAHVQWSREAVFSASAVNAGRARTFLTDNMLDHAVPRPLVDDVAVVGSELATHALHCTRAPFTVRLTQFPGYLRLEVLDSSPSKQNPTPLRVFNESSRAVAVVEGFSSQWGVSTVVDAGKPQWALWAAFDLS